MLCVLGSAGANGFPVAGGTGEAVSDLEFPLRGTMCPSPQFSGGHFSFLRDTEYLFYLI